MPRFLQLFILIALLAGGLAPSLSYAQDSESESSAENELRAEAGESRQAFVGKTLTFDTSLSHLPPETSLEEAFWDFGDGTKTTGEKVNHAYAKAGTYTIRLKITTAENTSEDTSTVEVFEHVAILLTDSSATSEQVKLRQQQSAEAGLLLIAIHPVSGGPEVVIEEELTTQLIDVRDAVSQANLIISWTSGSVGTNVLSKFSQHLRQSQDHTPTNSLTFADKGIIILSQTPFGVLAPTAQAVFDQLQPSYVLLTHPEAIELLLKPLTSEEAKNSIFNSPLEHRLLGPFSARTVKDIGITNFMSFGINFLVNKGVPINSITLILMLPVIATILSFTRQVIGIKAFGIITPAMTALSFLVIGLFYGLIVFGAVVASGTLTRLVLRKLQLLYLPRMALVLTSVSLAILLLLGLGVAGGGKGILSFSIFPVLILTLLAEEFISVQFSSGARQAFIITALTLILSISCYFIVSWQLLRATILSYPEVILLTIPVNILIGRFTGLRLTEYFRFRRLLRFSQ